jgi:glycosyltransferase involved in cell wall biosynthesis
VVAYNIGIDARKLTDFGIGTYIQNLIEALAKIDRENQYVLFARPEHVEHLEYLPDNFRTVVEQSPVYSIRELLVLAWRLLRLRLDLYHSTHYVLPAVVPCPAVVTIHDIIHLLYPEFLPNALAFFYAHRMIRRSLTRGTQIIAGSQNTKTDLLDHFDVNGEKIRVIYYGVADRFCRRIPKENLEAKLEKLGIRRPYLLFVGNPKPHKNLDNLVKAFAKARSLEPFDAHLVCVGGNGSETVRVRQRVLELGIEDRVTFTGWVPDDDLPAIYQGAELFVYPTLYEGFGLPVVEAMASGIPVITSDKSALKEVAEGYADLVNPVDVGEMANAIAHCMSDGEHRAALSELGRRRAADFRWEQTARKTLELYLKILEKQRDSEDV